MRKLMTLVLFVAFTAMSFAQKAELKAVEKALKNSNYADAKSAIGMAEGLLQNMDDKTKAKVLFFESTSLICRRGRK
jgi:hypothetical protein